MTDETLKPCPFCGEKVQLEIDGDLGYRQVRCQHCGAQGPIEVKEGDHVKQWNSWEEFRR